MRPNPYFTAAEVACRCGCGTMPNAEFMDRVVNLRVLHDRPLRVTSAARCAAYDAKIGGAGPHVTGRAIDFLVDRGDAYRLLSLALKMGFTGIGVAQKGDVRFLHLDDLPAAPGRPRPTLWSY